MGSLSTKFIIKSAGKSLSDMVQLERWSPGSPSVDCPHKFCSPKAASTRFPLRMEEETEMRAEGPPKEDELTLWVACLLQLNMQTGELPSLWSRDPLRYTLHPSLGPYIVGSWSLLPRTLLYHPQSLSICLRFIPLGNVQTKVPNSAHMTQAVMSSLSLGEEQTARGMSYQGKPWALTHHEDAIADELFLTVCPGKRSPVTLCKSPGTAPLPRRGTSLGELHCPSQKESLHCHPPGTPEPPLTDSAAEIQLPGARPPGREVS